MDCDDSNPNANPLVREVPGDDIDQNCDGIKTYFFFFDYDRDGYGNPGKALALPAPNGAFVANTTDCNDADASIHPNAEEIVGDGIDQNCDRYDDVVWFLDADNDGFGDPTKTTIATRKPAGYVSNDTDCDDSDPSSYPGATEIPGDTIDQNCNGDDFIYWYRDGDNDGYGRNSDSVYDDSPLSNPPTGYAPYPGDCDDNNSAINPGATEITEDGIDQDCDSYDNRMWFRDGDKDGYGVESGMLIAGPQPKGYVDNYLDCDDNAKGTNPGAIDLPADGIDQDCDGADSFYWFRDQDGDGFGDFNQQQYAEVQPDGYVFNPMDCDDGSAAVNPEQPEVVDDGIDQNCDGAELRTWYRDLDGDGLGDASVSIVLELTLEQEGELNGYVDNADDCDDADPTVGLCVLPLEGDAAL